MMLGDYLLVLGLRVERCLFVLIEDFCLSAVFSHIFGFFKCPLTQRAVCFDWQESLDPKTDQKGVGVRTACCPLAALRSTKSGCSLKKCVSLSWRASTI
jgi:hypothetical protein